MVEATIERFFSDLGRSVGREVRYAKRIAELDGWGETEEEQDPPERSEKCVRGRLDWKAFSNILFDYQRGVLDQTLHTLVEKESPAVLVSMPTGAGKTLTGLCICGALSNRVRQGRVFWLAPAVELVEQARDSLHSLLKQFGERDCASEGNEHEETEWHFMTLQRAYSQRAALRLSANDVMVLDEAHWSVGIMASALSIQSEDSGAKFIGLTATPGRVRSKESHELALIFAQQLVTPTVFGQDPIGFLRERGVLSEIAYHRISVPDENGFVRLTALSGKTKTLDDLATDRVRFQRTVDTVDDWSSVEQGVIFAASLAHVYSLGGALHNRGVRIGVLTYKTPLLRRARIIDAFRTGEIQILINKKILVAGFDVPKLARVLLTVPVRSPILWEQMIGRASRGPAVGGTSVAHVHEFDDHRKMHGDVLSYTRFGEHYRS